MLNLSAKTENRPTRAQLSAHLMLHVELVGEDGAGLLVELLDEGGQSVLVQVRNVGHVANLQQQQFSSIRP